jgi:hypothetical protein
MFFGYYHTVSIAAILAATTSQKKNIKTETGILSSPMLDASK